MHGHMQMLLLLLLFSLSEPVHRSTVQLFDLGVNLGKLQWVFEKHRGGDSSVCVSGFVYVEVTEGFLHSWSVLYVA